MSNPFEMIGAAMRAEADALRIVSVNVANAETTAYRRQMPVTHATQVQFDQLLGNATERMSLQSSSAFALEAPPMSTAIDLRVGTLKSSSEPLHLALDGPGFFALQLAQSGSNPTLHGMALTRRGDLRVTADGYLAAATGALVLGEKGPIQVGSAIPVIGADGTVRIDNQVVDRLRIVNVQDATKLSPLGDGTYQAEQGAISEGEQTAAVRQGFLESSNVTPINEIVQMMEIVRRFEAEQKYARAYDGMLEKAISELGKTS